MIARLKEHKGVTLVELLIVIALIGVVMTPISLFFVTNLNSFHRENDNLNAQLEAGRIMEEFTSKVMETRTYEIIDGKHVFTTSEAGAAAADITSWIFEYKATETKLNRNVKNNTSTLVLLSDNVTNFTISPELKNGKAELIIINLEVTVGRGSCSLTNTIYFRNFNIPLI